MSFNIHFMSSKRAMITASLILLAAACSTPSASEPSDASPGSGKPKSGQPNASPSLNTAITSVEPTSELAREPFRLERLLGATCSNAWMDEELFLDGGCYGYLPEHVKWFLENIPEQHKLYTAEMRRAVANERWKFIAAPGYGRRADFTVVLSDFNEMWLRSFEEKNGNFTWYLVYGPLCYSSSCGRGDVSFRNNFHLYKVKDRKTVEDMSRLFPLPPPMGQAERKRYGPLTTPDLPSTDDLGKL